MKRSALAGPSLGRENADNGALWRMLLIAPVSDLLISTPGNQKVVRVGLLPRAATHCRLPGKQAYPRRCRAGSGRCRGAQVVVVVQKVGAGGRDVRARIKKVGVRRRIHRHSLSFFFGLT